MLESRLVNRSRQQSDLYSLQLRVRAIVGSLPPSKWSNAIASQLEELRESMELASNDPSRTLLGATQLEWIRRQIQDSVAKHTTWQLIGQQTVMQDILSPDFEAAILVDATGRGRMWAQALSNLTENESDRTFIQDTNVPYRSGTRDVMMNVNTPWLGSTSARQLARIAYAEGKHRFPATFDAWGAYKAERLRFLEAIRGADNAVVFGGDSHDSWAGVLRDTNGGVVAVEFDVPSVSCPGTAEYLGFFPLDFLEQAFLSANSDNLRHVSLRNTGYMQVSLTHESQIVEFMSVDSSQPRMPNTVSPLSYPTQCEAAFKVNRRFAAKQAEEHSVDSGKSAGNTMERVECSLMQETEQGYSRSDGEANGSKQSSGGERAVDVIAIAIVVLLCVVVGVLVVRMCCNWRKARKGEMLWKVPKFRSGKVENVSPHARVID
eukprot:c4056_g1_i1.p1 GENE.c4056_g1_i1~~c4056_g1_i1.p1  ORF type:complete len:434 (-),score=108.08 c4056_g1_i1:152-1453(-)